MLVLQVLHFKSKGKLHTYQDDYYDYYQKREREKKNGKEKEKEISVDEDVDTLGPL